MIDNHSQDKSTTIIRSEFPEVKLVEFPQNFGFAYAVNAGIDVAEGDYIALLNNDAKAEPEWIKKLVEALESDPDIGLAASRVLCHHNSELVDSAGDAITSSGRCFNIAHYNRDQESLRERRWVMGATGAACMLKRSTIEDVGKFDEDFFLYLEDVDLSLRCQIKGYKCVYEPEAVVHHVGSAISENVHGLKTYYLTRNYFPLLIKNFPKSIFLSHFPLFLMHLLYQGLYHLLFSKTPSAFLRGLFHGTTLIRPSLAKRKQILGGRRITDDEFRDLLHFGNIAWRITRRNRQKPPSKNYIEITKGSPSTP